MVRVKEGFYKSWILAEVKDIKTLQDLGEELGPYIDNAFSDCIVSEEAMLNLEQVLRSILLGVGPD